MSEHDNRNHRNRSRSLLRDMRDFRISHSQLIDSVESCQDLLNSNNELLQQHLESLPPTSSHIQTHDIPASSSYQNQPNTITDLIPISIPSDKIVSQAWVLNLMNTFKLYPKGPKYTKNFKSIFPLEVLDWLVSKASFILHEEPNCVKVNKKKSLGPDSRVIVVGDLHGQLNDLLFLLQNAGYPSDDRIFIFNGDYVDRGAHGVEIFLILLAWKVYLPNKVFLLRGNHESASISKTYGFKKEVSMKYESKSENEGLDEIAYNLFLNCFKSLPIASKVADHTFTAHGGLFRSVIKHTRLSLGSLAELKHVNRFVLDPEKDDVILSDILWSDPFIGQGLAENEDRGAGLVWGSDCTKKFLDNHNLKLIIRSHEGPDARRGKDGLDGMHEGFTRDHPGLCTVFSAPNYQNYKNRGAYVVLQPPDYSTPEFVSFEAVSQQKRKGLRLRQFG